MKAQGVTPAAVGAVTSACGVRSCPSEHQEQAGTREASNAGQQHQRLVACTKITDRCWKRSRRLLQSGRTFICCFCNTNFNHTNL